MSRGSCKLAVLAALAVSPSNGFLPAPRLPSVAIRSSSMQWASASGSLRRATSWTSSNSDLRARRSSVTCLAMKDSLMEVPEDMDGVELEVVDPVSKQTLTCYADRIAKVGGEEFIVCYPVDDAVAIAMREDDDIAPVAVDDPIMDKIFPIAVQQLEGSSGATLLRTPVTLTMRGLEEYYDDDEEEEGEGEEGAEGEMDEDDDEEMEGGDDDYDDEEDVELVTEFDVEDETFLLVRYLDPLLMVARKTSGGKYSLIEDADEDERIMSVVEELMSVDE